MQELALEHVTEGHDYPVAGCEVCEKDALLDYQQSIIDMVFDDYIGMVSYVDRVVKGIRAYQQITEENQESIIPTERSRLWVKISEGPLPLEGEEVWIMVQLLTNDDKVQHAKIRGYRRGDKWFSQEVKREIDSPVFWRKIRGQLPLGEPDPDAVVEKKSESTSNFRKRVVDGLIHNKVIVD